MPYRSSERLISCLAKCLPLLCEVDFVPCLCERLYWLREELCTPGYCIAQNPKWRFTVWEVLCGRYSGNLFCVKAGT